MKLAFQWPALMLVALSAAVLALLTRGQFSVYWVLFIPALWMMATWILKYGFALLDAAANGEKQAPVASVEMLGPFGDERAWAWPIFASALVIAGWPLPPALRVVLAVLTLWILPLSLASMAVSDRFLDAFNPLAWWRALLGLGLGWPLLAAAMCGAAFIGMLAWRSSLPVLVRIATVEMLFLCVHALVGSLVHARRQELGFSPRHSPERDAERVDAARGLERQRVFDEVYAAARVRRDDQACAALDRWLDNCDARQAAADITALVAAGSHWNEPRGYGAVLRHLIGRCCERRLPGQALAIVEHALALSPRFAPEPADQVVMIARYAAQTGRRRTALQLLDNALLDARPDSRPLLEALQGELAR